MSGGTLGERVRAAERGHRVAEALKADVVIDLDNLDVAHLVYEHRQLLDAHQQVKAENERLRHQIDQLLTGGDR